MPKNKYLEKLANDHMWKAYLSPAWQENAIAKDHGEEGPVGAKENLKSHFKGSFRAAGRGLVEGAAVAASGAALGVLGAVTHRNLRGLPIKGSGHDARLGATIGGLAGNYVGQQHGVYKSYRNQAKDHHKKYSKD